MEAPKLETDRQPQDGESPFRRAIRERCRQAGLSFNELSFLAGYSHKQCAISHFLTGRRGMSVTKLERLCDILNLTLQPAPKKANRSKHGTRTGADHNVFGDS